MVRDAPFALAATGQRLPRYPHSCKPSLRCTSNTRRRSRRRAWRRIRCDQGNRIGVAAPACPRPNRRASRFDPDCIFLAASSPTMCFQRQSYGPDRGNDCRCFGTSSTTAPRASAHSFGCSSKHRGPADHQRSTLRRGARPRNPRGNRAAQRSGGCVALGASPAANWSECPVSQYRCPQSSCSFLAASPAPTLIDCPGYKRELLAR